ncbi:MAG TPA: hypothetical protein VGQ54_05285, partial [Burkholderiales bacterium]|nr:hypothetical protein [Burkholderiales bacterium]
EINFDSLDLATISAVKRLITDGIAVGISGAVQHVAGISAARTVVAINTDADADIFTRADYGVVGDYREVLPAFIERIKQLQS